MFFGDFKIIFPSFSSLKWHFLLIRPRLIPSSLPLFRVHRSYSLKSYFILVIVIESSRKECFQMGFWTITPSIHPLLFIFHIWLLSSHFHFSLSPSFSVSSIYPSDLPYALSFNHTLIWTWWPLKHSPTWWPWSDSKSKVRVELEMMWEPGETVREDRMKWYSIPRLHRNTRLRGKRLTESWCILEEKERTKIESEQEAGTEWMNHEVSERERKEGKIESCILSSRCEVVL